MLGVSTWRASFIGLGKAPELSLHCSFTKITHRTAGGHMIVSKLNEHLNYPDWYINSVQSRIQRISSSTVAGPVERFKAMAMNSTHKAHMGETI